MRHPGRRFPGILLQGDIPYSLCQKADRLCSDSRNKVNPELYNELNSLRNSLQHFLNQYKTALDAHNIPLPFSELPTS
jgi:hypothetical protein